MSDSLTVLDLLDRIQPIRSCSGISDTVTWSRARHSSAPGEPPLRSRARPLGVSGLDTNTRDKVQQSDREVEVVCWLAEQALCFSTRSVPTCPEDLEDPFSTQTNVAVVSDGIRPWRSARSWFSLSAHRSRTAPPTYFVQIGPFSRSTMSYFTTMVRCQIAVHDLRISGR